MTLMEHNSKAEAPLGAVRLRDAGNGQRVRMVKIRMDGPTGLRWVPWAKWWWEQQRGPVPQGKRICHADGNLLNDDPDNLVSLTPGEVFNLYHKIDPEMSRRNHRACGQSASRRNVENGQLNRGRFLENLWYGVDLSARVIHNRPSRKRWMILHDHGAFEQLGGMISRRMGDATSGDTSAAADAFEKIGKLHWRWMWSMALGWPCFSSLSACILHVLDRAASPLPQRELFARVIDLRQMIGWRPFADNAPNGPLKSCASMLALTYRHWGLCTTTRSGAVWQITDRALANKLPGPHVIPMRGRNLVRDCFAGFERRDYPYESTKRRDITAELLEAQ